MHDTLSYKLPLINVVYIEQHTTSDDCIIHWVTN